MLKKSGILKITLVFAAAVAFFPTNYCLADNLLADNGFELSEPNGSFPNSGRWTGTWPGYSGAGCTTTSARTGSNGLWQYTGLAGDHWYSKMYQDTPTWPNRVFFASCWVRSAFAGSSWVTDSRAFIKLEFLDESKHSLAQYTSDELITADIDWSLLSFATHPSPAHTRFVRFQLVLEKPESVGQTIVNFDDCILREIECSDCLLLDEIPPCPGEMGQLLRGSVVGVNSDDYSIGVYIFVDAWWPKPTFAEPWTVINPDGSWQCNVGISPSDLSATEVMAFLVPKDEISQWPVNFNDHSGLPAMPGEAFRFPSTGAFRPSCFSKILHFADANWLVKDSRDIVAGPGPNLFASDNAWLDDNNNLHLKITSQDGQWRCAEVFTQDSLGDGVYTFEIENNIASLDPNVVLGLFTWDEFASHYTNREMDIEFGRWGVPGNDNAQYAIQPSDKPGLIERFNVDPCDADTITNVIDWSIDNVAFESYFGPALDESQIINSWAYSGNAVPRPGQENARINLWLRSGLAPSDGQEVEVVVRDFNFVPCSYTVETDKLDFDSVLISQKATMTATISNGQFCSPYTVTVEPNGPDADYFLVADRAFAMEPGASKDITVTFMPDSDRVFEATLDIRGDGRLVSIPVTGKGVHLGYTRVPTIGSPDFLEGTVSSVARSNYRVVSYVLTDKWYVKPSCKKPMVKPAAKTGAWRCDIDVEPTDVLATQVASFLVPKNADDPPCVLDSLDDALLSGYDRVSADKPKLGILSVSAKSGTADDDDSITIDGRYFVDMIEILSADQLCIELLQSDNSLRQICVPFDFINFVKNNRFSYDKNGVHIRLKNFKRLSESFAGNFQVQLLKSDLTCLKSPLTLNVRFGDFDETAVADEELNSRVINGSQPVPIQFLSGCANAIRVDKVSVRRGSKSSGDSFTIRGSLVFKGLPPDLTEQDVDLGWGNALFTVPAGSFKRIGKTGLKFACTNAPAAPAGFVNAVFDFQKFSFLIKVSKTKIYTQLDTLVFNLAFTGFSQGVSVETGK